MVTDILITHSDLFLQVMMKRKDLFRIHHLKSISPSVLDTLMGPQRRQWHPLQYSCLENPTDGGAWWAAVHGVAKSRTRLSDFTFNFHFLALETEMATHSSVFACRISGTGEPGGLSSMGSHRVRHDWIDLAVAAAKMLMSLSPKSVNMLRYMMTGNWGC